ncbi:MAG: hypothetical protein ABFS34_16770 [Gemmatimonadota bacterium]
MPRPATAVTPPRIYCIPATDAPIVAVFRRGPSAWSHVGRWDIAEGQYEPGGWLKGRIFPRRSDLSPDGRYLCYFAHKPTATWEHGDAYVALSRLPWLSALHAFAEIGTWTRGYAFNVDGSVSHPDDEGLPMRWGLEPLPTVQFALERRRGWEEAADSPPRRPDDFWDQHRNARIRKPEPGGERVLCVESHGWAGGEFGKGQAVDGLRVSYSMEREGDVRLLADIQWADWSLDGRLLVATRDGRIQIRGPASGREEVAFDEDLTALTPNPQPAPAWACRW